VRLIRPLLLTIFGISSVAHAQNSAIEQYLAQQPKIRIVSYNGLEQPQELAEGYCELPRPFRNAAGAEGLAGTI